MNYKHLSASERDDIAFYLMKGYSYRQIGRLLNRHHTTIMREYKRYFAHSGECYYAFGAHLRAVARKSNSVQRECLKCAQTRRYVEKKLKLAWSPEIIAGRLKHVETLPSVSYEAIYQYIYVQAKHLIGCLPRRHPKHQSCLYHVEDTSFFCFKHFYIRWVRVIRHVNTPHDTEPVIGS